MAEFRGDNRAAHYHDRGVKRLPDVRHVDALAFGYPINIDADDAIGAPAKLVERQRIGSAAVDENPAVDDHWPKQARYRNRGRERLTQRSGCNGQFTAAVQVGCHGDERNRQLRKIVRHLRGHKLLAEFVRIDLRRLAQPAG